MYFPTTYEMYVGISAGLSKQRLHSQIGPAKHLQSLLHQPDTRPDDECLSVPCNLELHPSLLNQPVQKSNEESFGMTLTAYKLLIVEKQES